MHFHTMIFGSSESKLLEFCNLCQHFGNAMQYNLKSVFISVSGCMDKIEITETCYSITYIMHLCISLFFLDLLLSPLTSQISSLL